MKPEKNLYKEFTGKIERDEPDPQKLALQQVSPDKFNFTNTTE